MDQPDGLSSKEGVGVIIKSGRLGRFGDMFEMGESSKISSLHPIKVCRFAPFPQSHAISIVSLSKVGSLSGEEVIPFQDSIQGDVENEPNGGVISHGNDDLLDGFESQSKALVPVEEPLNRISPIVDRGFGSSIGEKVQSGRRRSSCEMVVAVDLDNFSLDASPWVLERMEEFSKFLGMSFEGMERQAWDFFTTLEREGSISGLRRKGNKMHREVKNLVCGVNNSKRIGRAGRTGMRSLHGSVP